MSLTDKELQNKRVQLAFLSCRFILIFFFSIVFESMVSLKYCCSWSTLIQFFCSVIKVFCDKNFYKSFLSNIIQRHMK